MPTYPVFTGPVSYIAAHHEFILMHTITAPIFKEIKTKQYLQKKPNAKDKKHKKFEQSYIVSMNSKTLLCGIPVTIIRNV